MSGMSKFLSSFHYAAKHCLTILWQILEYIQKSHFIFFQNDDQIPLQIWATSTSSCLSSLSDLQFRRYKYVLLHHRFSIQISVWLAYTKPLQIIFSVSGSSRIQRPVVPKMATHPMTSKYTDEPHFNFSPFFFFFLSLSTFSIILARKRHQKGKWISEKHLFHFFFSFELGSGFRLYPSQWIVNFRNNTEIPEWTLASKAFTSMKPEFLCQQSMPKCI